MTEKYQREIEEILEKTTEPAPRETFKGRGGAPRRRVTIPLGWLFAGKKWSISPGKLFLASVLLLLAALVINSTTARIVGPLVWIAVFLFIAAYAMFFIRPGIKYEKRWRGRPLEESLSLWDRVKKWLRG
ncbi:MAG: hypothetical protein ACE5IG_00065 [Dehalococcoidia bacterium]